MRRNRRSSAALLGLAVAAAGCQGEDGFSLTPPGLDLTDPSAAEPKSYEPCTDLPEEQRVIREILSGVNAERARHGLRPMRLDPTLMQMAEFWACRMIEDDFFGHEDPYDGSTVDSRAVNFGYAFRKIGENLAAGHRTAEELLAHWLRSPGHRANILDPAFVEIGIAVKGGGQYGIYWVQAFGRPITAGSERSVGRSAESGGSGEADDGPSTQPVSAGPAGGTGSDSPDGD